MNYCLIIKEMTHTVKESNAGTDGLANFAAELKLKADVNDNIHDATIKNSGEIVYDLKASGLTQV